MRRSPTLLACALGAGLLLTAIGGVVAQRLLERAERVKRQMAKAAAKHASLRGSKGLLPDDNSLCLLCHANFRDETLVTTHLQRGITCAHCHGISYEHMDDETSRTKPDLLFGRAQVAGLCRRCHSEHQQPEKVAAFLEDWKSKTRPNGRLILRQAMCTDCHGEHALASVPSVTDEAPNPAGP